MVYICSIYTICSIDTVGSINSWVDPLDLEGQLGLVNRAGLVGLVCLFYYLYLYDFSYHLISHVYKILLNIQKSLQMALFYIHIYFRLLDICYTFYHHNSFHYILEPFALEKIFMLAKVLLVSSINSLKVQK